MNRFVEIKAAEFNGKQFDGNPFSDLPDWLSLLEARKQIGIAPSNTDYAVWSIENDPAEGRMFGNDEDHPLLAWPGDLIVFTKEEKPVVVKYRSYRNLDNAKREEFLAVLRSQELSADEVQQVVEEFKNDHR